VLREEGRSSHPEVRVFRPDGETLSSARVASDDIADHLRCDPIDVRPALRLTDDRDEPREVSMVERLALALENANGRRAKLVHVGRAEGSATVRSSTRVRSGWASRYSRTATRIASWVVPQKRRPLRRYAFSPTARAGEPARRSRRVKNATAPGPRARREATRVSRDPRGRRHRARAPPS
jgi:hypothetical protein